MNSDEILKRIESAATYYSTLMAEFKKKREYASGRYQIKLPANVIAYKDITPVTNVDVAANALVTDIPSFNIQLPHEASSADEERRDKQLRALSILFRESEKLKIPPLRDCAINLPKYGAATQSIWWLEEFFDLGEFNFLWKSHNPECFLPIGKDEGAEIYTIKSSDVEEFLAEFNEGKRKKVVDWNKPASLGETVEIIKYTRSWREGTEWKGERAFFVGKIPIFQDSSIAKNGVQQNVLGVYPYVSVVSGWAGSSAEGKPEDEARGINDFLFSTFDEISFIKSMIFAKLAVDVVGRYTQTCDDDQIVYGENIWDPIRVSRHEDLKLLDQRKVDPEGYQALGQLQQQVSDNTFGAGSRGIAQGSSGSQEAVLIGQDLKKMRVPRAQLESGLEQICQKMFYIAKQLGGITYNGKTILAPKDIVFPINLDVSLEPIDPAEQQAKILMLKEVWVAGGISWENFAIRSGIVDDISLERKLIEINKTMNDPAVRQIIGQQALQEWATAEQIATLQQMGKAKPKSNPANMGAYGSAATQTEVNSMKSQMGMGQVDTSQMMPQGVLV